MANGSRLGAPFLHERMGNDSYYVTISRAAFVALLLLNAVLWLQGSYGQVHHKPSHDFSKRSLPGLLESKQYSTYEEGGSECRPIAVPVEHQCRVVQDSCPTSDTFLAIQYLKAYFCASPATRPFVFVGLLLWLMFLFTTLGISASDFFCPNLATIANLLNLDENVAGVTFLAFGNGSPDVFATFSALRSNAGSLAIGELLGAASFIVSCVVGSMCIIKPFRVNRGPFLRDAAFFTAAVAMLLGILLDGWIYAWEAALLLMLYLVYVFTVVVGSWWEYRQQKRLMLEARIRGEYAEEGTPPYTDDEPYQDDPTHSPSNPPLSPPGTGRRRLSSLPRLEFQTQPLNLQVQDSQADSRSPLSSPRLPTMPSFSLVGALEFRSVISSLQQDAAGYTLSAFDSPLTPLTPYPGGHYHGYGHPRSRSRGSIHSASGQTWDTSSDVPLSDRSPLPPATSLVPDDSDIHTTEVPLIHIDSDSELQIPEISHIPPSPISDSGSDMAHDIVAEPPQEAGFVLAHACHILFPTLHGFHAKSLLGKSAAILATPAVFALTITLPVVVGPYDSSVYRHEKPSTINDTLVAFEGDGSEHVIDEVEEEVHGLHFNKWLMALQCTLGPLFCVVVLLEGTMHERWIVLGTGLAGLITGVFVAFFADKGDHRGWLLVRCSMGFFVAIVWIMAIADEIINVLRTFGFVFGLSDAIIGLTIFAVGNSLADLVANMSVAVFAPVMGFSACFGGPMLNILFGVGISGSYVIYHTAEPYRLHFSNTLLVSAVGLLALLVTTMIFVPMNGYFLPRKWGVFLICFYVVIMIINVVVEVLGFDS